MVKGKGVKKLKTAWGVFTSEDIVKIAGLLSRRGKSVIIEFPIYEVKGNESHLNVIDLKEAGAI